MFDCMNNQDPASLASYAARAQEDYRALSVFIRALAPDDPQVQHAANAALLHYRLLLGKLTWLMVTLEGE